jgi:CubicO group peptidase (beta-lactamase class C family)
MADLTIYGDCDPRFERVRGTFVENFQRHGEVGAAVSVMVDGHCAVDLWAGHADQNKTHAWERDTIVNVWSTTKGLCAMCAHRLAAKSCCATPKYRSIARPLATRLARL